MTLRSARPPSQPAPDLVHSDQMSSEAGFAFAVSELSEALAEAAETTPHSLDIPLADRVSRACSMAARAGLCPIVQNKLSQELATDLPSLVRQLQHTCRLLGPFGARRAWRAKVEHATKLIDNAALDLKEVIACDYVTSTLMAQLKILDKHRSRNAKNSQRSVQDDLPALGEVVVSFVKIYWTRPWHEIELSFRRMKRSHAKARQRCRKNDSDVYACLLMLQGCRGLVKRIHARRISPTRIRQALEAAVVIVRGMKEAEDTVGFGPAWLHESVAFLNNAVYLLREMQRKVEDSNGKKKFKLSRMLFMKDYGW